MLSLVPGSACDVCAEEYGPHRMPHSISCGHVLCASCCSTIIEKTSPRFSPVCPFCREVFTNDSVRLIRVDFSSSGWTTPRRLPTVVPNSSDFANEVLAKRTERLLLSEGSRAKLEVRRLEDKVARVAAKKCSVEEISSLHKELEEWLTSNVNVKDDQTSLYLSAALLRAILMNHLSHSEASKNAKATEANLKGKLDDLEMSYGKTETELRRQKTQYNQKLQECQQLRTEVSQLKALATTIGISASDAQQSQSTSPPPSSSTPLPPYTSTTQSPLSRYNSMHVRSASMSSRPTTPATPAPLMRSHTPAITPRSHTPAVPPVRSHTPAPPRSHTPAVTSPPRSHTPAVTSSASTRSHTPAVMSPPRSHTPAIRSHTPALRPYTPAPTPSRMNTPTPSSMQYRTQTPAPLIPPKPRRLSQTSPPKMMRTTSEEKAEAHELWIPPLPDPDYPEYGLPPSSKASKYASRPPSRTASYSISSAAAAARYREARSPSPG